MEIEDVQEFKEIKEINKPITFSFKSPTLWAVGFLIIMVMIFTFILTNFEIIKGYKFKQTLETLVVLIGMIGLYFTFKTLVNTYNLNIRLAKQAERHYLKNLETQTILSNKIIDYEKKKISNDIITEWYSKFMEKSFIARNFRLGFMDSNGGLIQDDIDSAIIKMEKEEIELLKEYGNKLREGFTLLPVSEEKFFVRKVLVPIFNYFEKVSCAIENGIADEDILKEFFLDLFLIYGEAYYKFIDIRRKPYNGTANAFDSYMKVYERWSLKGKMH